MDCYTATLYTIVKSRIKSASLHCDYEIVQILSECWCNLFGNTIFPLETNIEYVAMT